MATASVIVTDSGGVQEEAPSLGVPVLVLRRTTERPEALETGANRLVGTDPDDVEQALCAALERPRDTRAFALPRPSPFGDGRASERIAQTFLHLAGLCEAPEPFARFEEEEEIPDSFEPISGPFETPAIVRSH